MPIDWEEEYEKCMNSPYYFATRYVKIQTSEGVKSFTTGLSEKCFNEIYFQDKLAFSWSLTKPNILYFFRTELDQIEIDTNHLEAYLDIKSKILTIKEKQTLKEIFYVRGRTRKLRKKPLLETRSES